MNDQMTTQLPDELRDQLDHCDGYGCTCHAAYSGECGCWADWRSENEVVMDWMLEHPETMHEVLDLWARVVASTDKTKPTEEDDTKTAAEKRMLDWLAGETPCASVETQIASLKARLLPEGCHWPTYADGTPVSIGDRYVNISEDVRTVEYVTVEVGASALCSHDLDDDIYEPGEHVRRPAPADSWDQLRDDATLPPASYCDRHDVNLDDGWEPSDAVQAMALDVIDRAERLAKGGEGR